jgi:hypothetical protein
MSSDDETDARERSHYCTTGLQALDAFEAAESPHEVANFLQTEAHPLNHRKVHMGLQRLREKLRAEAYSPKP